MAAPPTHLFISYSYKDIHFAHHLRRLLEAQKYNVSLNELQFEYLSWRKNIEQQIVTCSVFILVMSDEAKQSDAVGRETRLAIQHNKPILPILYNGEAWSDIPYIDMRSGLQEKLPDSLINALNRAMPGKGVALPPVTSQPETRLPVKSLIAIVALIAILGAVVIAMRGQQAAPVLIDPTLTQGSDQTAPPGSVFQATNSNTAIALNVQTATAVDEANRSVQVSTATSTAPPPSPSPPSITYTPELTTASGAIPATTSSIARNLSPLALAAQPTFTSVPTASPTNTPRPTSTFTLTASATASNTPTHTPTASATATRTPVPTASPTNTPRPTATRTAIPSQTPTRDLSSNPSVIQGDVSSQDCVVTPRLTFGANMRTGPGTAYPVHDLLGFEQTTKVNGQVVDPNGVRWWRVINRGQNLWVYSEAVTSTNNCNTVPLVATPEPPVNVSPDNGNRATVAATVVPQANESFGISVSVGNVGAAGTSIEGGCSAIAYVTVTGAENVTGRVFVFSDKGDIPYEWATFNRGQNTYPISLTSPGQMHYVRVEVQGLGSFGDYGVLCP